MQRLLAQLRAHRAIDADETRHVETLCAFIEHTSEPCSRLTLSGHVTGSAVVLDPAGRALLLHHARLGLWVQPGGHMEDEERHPSQAALREALEETGLADLQLAQKDSEPWLLDVDVHPIPHNAKRGEPAHLHHDVCYLARTRHPEKAVIDPDESRAFRWVNVHELDTLPLDPATRRRLLKAFAPGAPAR